MSSISLWYTGTAHNWELLRDKNQLQPEKLHLGTTVRIPENLLQRREPMPEAFISRRYAARKKSTKPKIQKAAIPKRTPQKTASLQPKLPDVPELPMVANVSAEVPANEAHSAKEQEAAPADEKAKAPYLRAALKVEKTENSVKSLAEMDCEVLRGELMDKLLECRENSDISQVAAQEEPLPDASH